MALLDLPLIVPAIRLDEAAKGGDAKGEEAKALARASKRWCAGFLVFGGEAGQVARLVERLRMAAGRAIFVASDMERGAGQQVAGLRSLPDAAVWGSAATPEEVEAFGEITARDARSVGVDLLFAPVVDVRSEPKNPIVGNRAFGWDPEQVARAADAFCRGARRGGALPTAKHYPGHGATLSDSHDAVPVVTDPAGRVLARDVEPFVRVVRAGCPAVMTAHVSYPTLDRSRAIATFSRKIVQRLRDALDAGADVTVFTDALLMAGALGAGSEVAAARLALRAGCDGLLYPTDPEGVARELFGEKDAALREGAETAAARLAVLAGLCERAGHGVPPEPAGLAAVPGRVAERALARGGGDALAPERGWVVVLDDDGVPERGRVLAERGRAAGVPVTVVRSSDGPELEASPVTEGWTVVVMSSVRAWKGAAVLSPQGRAALDRALAARRPPRVVWCAPLARHGDVHLPGTGPDVEAALSSRLFR
jgi:beta-glucosidase-like glycosyl hydrolase